MKPVSEMLRTRASTPSVPELAHPCVELDGKAGKATPLVGFSAVSPMRALIMEKLISTRRYSDGGGKVHANPAVAHPTHLSREPVRGLRR